MPNVAWAFQRDQLQQSQRDGRNRDKAFITCPAAFDVLEAFLSGLFQGLVFLRFARVSWHPFGAKVIVKRTDEMFERGEHGLHTDASTIEVNRSYWAHGQITTHQDDGAVTGQRKDKADKPSSGLAKQIGCKERDVFEVAIDLTACLVKEMHVIKDLVQFDFVAVFTRSARAADHSEPASLKTGATEKNASSTSRQGWLCSTAKSRAICTKRVAEGGLS